MPSSAPAISHPAPSPAPVPAPPPATEPVVNHLQVPAREFSLSLSHSFLSAGSDVVELDNFGEDAHNLRIERTDGTGSAVTFPTLEPGKVGRQSVALTPGSYHLYCTLPGHEAAGMSATLTVR